MTADPAPMYAMFWLITLLAADAIWPVTVAGWVALALSFVALVAAMIGWGKSIERTNGLGKRVLEVEMEQERAKERDQSMLLALQGVLSAQSQLLEKIGEAKKVADDCGERERDFAHVIGVKIDEFRREVHVDARKTGERLAALEARLPPIR